MAMRALTRIGYMHEMMISVIFCLAETETGLMWRHGSMWLGTTADLHHS